LPAYPESGGHIGYWLPINLAPPQHLITHLHQIAGIKELIPLERFVLYMFRVRMKGSVLVEDSGLRIDGSAGCVRVCLFHMCQLYYVPI
jgi:hypothetical protein